MSLSNAFRSDLQNIFNIVQSSMIVYPKDVIIESLRDYFSKDSSYYHFSKDAFGFVNNPDHTDLPLDAGIKNELSTRIFIGESFRQNEGIFYPCVLVKNSGSKYVPISINRENQSVQYEARIFEDGYGNQKIISNPKCFIFAGAWEGTISIDIKARSIRQRDDIVEAIAIFFTDLNFENLEDVGIICKPITISSPSEAEDRNDKLFQQTITMDIRTEWRREIPVSNIIERIMFEVEFQNINNPNSVPSHNLTINTDVSYVDMMLNL